MAITARDGMNGKVRFIVWGYWKAIRENHLGTSGDNAAVVQPVPVIIVVIPFTCYYYYYHNIRVRRVLYTVWSYNIIDETFFWNLTMEIYENDPSVGSHILYYIDIPR